MRTNKKWQALAKSEVKSRIYLALVKRKINIAKLCRDEFNKDERKDWKYFKGYDFSHIQKTVGEMVDEGILEQEPAERKGKGRHEIKKYCANIEAYLDFLKDCAKADEEELREVRKVILGLAPALNKIGTADRPNVDALFDITLCGVASSYFIADTPKEAFFNGLCSYLKKMLETPPLTSLEFVSKTLKKLAAAMTERLYTFPKVELDRKIVKDAEKLNWLFTRGLMTAAFLIPMTQRKDLDKITRLMESRKSPFFSP